MPSTLRHLRLLADPSRLRILLLLAKEELSVAELQDILGMGQSSISTHLAQMKQAGLLEDRREGKSIYYHLRVRRGAQAESFTRLRAVLEDAHTIRLLQSGARVRAGHVLVLPGAERRQAGQPVA